MSSELQLHACDRCHRRKTKCDKTKPECLACQKSHSRCVYSARIKEPLYRRDFVEKLEKRARQLEQNNRVLSERLASATGQTPSSETLGSIADGSHAADSSVPPFALGPNGPVKARDDVANEVSFFSTHAGGERQFLGSASGLFLAGLVKASVQQQLEPLRSRLASPGDVSPANWSIDHGALPPQQLAQSLIDAYLAHDVLCYPILHPKSVLRTVNAIYANSAQYRSNSFDAFVFNMLLAIATAQVYKFNWQALPDAETHHQRAMVHLNSVLSAGGIQALQAMLLCCQFRLSSSSKDASGSLWHLVGIASRMCFELGLHRESTYTLKESGSIIVDDTLLSPWEAQEIQRKCFWSVFALDRVVSITLGRPLAISVEDIDVELPSVRFEEGVSPSDESGSNPDLSRMGSSYRVVIFVHIVRYRALCGKFLTSLHRGGRNNTLSEAQFRDIRSQLACELETWRADTAALKLPDMDLSTPLAEARSSFRSKAWYELLYQNGVLLLYRPTPTVGSIELPERDDSVQRIYAAAKQSVTLYAYLFRSRKINFSWITLHAVFLAGLSYVYAVSRHLREKRRQRMSAVRTAPRAMLPQDPSIVEIVNDTRACSNVLVAVSERCNAPKNCHEVFDRLSDAVLADAVELYTSPAPALQDSGTMASYAGVHMDYMEGGTNDSTLDAPSSSGLIYPSTRGYLSQDPLLAVDNALRDSLPDLQHIYDASWGDDAIFQLSMDWLEGLEANSTFMDSTSAQEMSQPFNT